MATVEEIKALLEVTKTEIITSITTNLDEKFDAFKNEIEDKVDNATATINDMKSEYDQKLERGEQRMLDAESMVAD